MVIQTIYNITALVIIMLVIAVFVLRKKNKDLKDEERSLSKRMTVMEDFLRARGLYIKDMMLSLNKSDIIYWAEENNIKGLREIESGIYIYKLGDKFFKIDIAPENMLINFGPYKILELSGFFIFYGKDLRIGWETYDKYELSVWLLTHGKDQGIATENIEHTTEELHKQITALGNPENPAETEKKEV